MPITYRYELRDGHEIVATGQITEESPLQVGDPITLGRTRGTIRGIAPALRGGELRLIVKVNASE